MDEGLRGRPLDNVKAFVDFMPSTINLRIELSLNVGAFVEAFNKIQAGQDVAAGLARYQEHGIIHVDIYGSPRVEAPVYKPWLEFQEVEDRAVPWGGCPFSLSTHCPSLRRRFRAIPEVSRGWNVGSFNEFRSEEAARKIVSVDGEHFCNFLGHRRHRNEKTVYGENWGYGGWHGRERYIVG